MKCPTTILFILILPLAYGQQARQEAERYYTSGENARNTGRYEEALRNFNTCVQLDAGYYEAYTSRAAVKERLGDWPGAVTDYSIYLEKFPNHAETLFSRAIARYEAKQYRFAIDDFILFLDMPGGNETNAIYYRQSAFGGGTDGIMTAQGNIKDQVFNYLGLAEFHLEEYTQAIVYFDSAIALNPGEADYYVHRGLAKQEGTKDTHGAEADYKKALALNEDHPLALHNLGVLIREGPDPAAAEAHFSKAIERFPELPYSYLERAHFRMTTGNLRGALSDYNKALALNDSDADAWVNRGLVKDKLNDLKGAYQDFTQAIERRANYEKAWFCRGNVLSKMNRLQDALEDYSVALLYYPEYALALYNRAIVQQRMGQLVKACEDLERAEAAGMKVNEHLREKVCR